MGTPTDILRCLVVTQSLCGLRVEQMDLTRTLVEMKTI